MRQGRPPKALSVLQDGGNYRPDRHGHRRDQPALDKMDDMYDWDYTVVDAIEQLVTAGLVKKVDIPAMHVLTSLDKIRHSLLASHSEGADVLNKYLSVCRLWLEFAKRFGMTPGDRRYLDAPESQEETEKEAFFE